jgi:hypothetical protein
MLLSVHGTSDACDERAVAIRVKSCERGERDGRAEAGVFRPTSAAIRSSNVIDIVEPTLAPSPPA